MRRANNICTQVRSHLRVATAYFLVRSSVDVESTLRSATVVAGASMRQEVDAAIVPARSAFSVARKESWSPVSVPAGTFTAVSDIGFRCLCCRLGDHGRSFRWRKQCRLAVKLVNVFRRRGTAAALSDYPISCLPPSLADRWRAWFSEQRTLSMIFDRFTARSRGERVIDSVRCPESRSANRSKERSGRASMFAVPALRVLPNRSPQARRWLNL
jgi:hypothetical protein